MPQGEGGTGSGREALLQQVMLDGALFALAARATVLKRVEVVVVHPGMHEVSRVTGALCWAVEHGARRLICTGTNAAERRAGEVYDRARLSTLLRQEFPRESPVLRLEADVAAESCLQQARNAVRRLRTRPPQDGVLVTGGSWHTPRAYLTLLQAVLDEFPAAGLPLPGLFPLLLDTDLGRTLHAGSQRHEQDGYDQGLPEALEAEAHRRWEYTRRGHLAGSGAVMEYLRRLVSDRHFR